MQDQRALDTPMSPGPESAVRPATEPAFYKRRKHRGNEIGQILLRASRITPEALREALRIQQQNGGLVGAILHRMGACASEAIAEALLEQIDAQKPPAEAKAHLLRARENPSIVGLAVACRPALTAALLLGSDALALLLAGGIVQHFFPGGEPTLGRFWATFAATVACLFAFALGHLYASTPPSPPEEIRRLTLTITSIYLGFYILGFLEHTGALAATVQRATWAYAWLLSIVLVPMARGAVKETFAGRPFFGTPTLVLGAGLVGRRIVATLRNHPELGLKPVAVLDDDPRRHGTLRATWTESDIELESVRDPELGVPPAHESWGRFSEIAGVPVVGGLDLAPALAQRLGIRCAIVAMPELESAQLVATLERVAWSFNEILVVPDLLNIAHYGAPARSLGGVLGIEVRRQLLRKGPRVVKRIVDVVLTVLGGLLVLPILLLLAVVIRLDSRGPALYRQQRLGQDGVRFWALKFRTMHGDGEERLLGLLARDPGRRAEYEQFHKLTDDPRVTRLGRLLRKYSLDELPQIWNVLVGDMSLVGPRPYLDRELPEMDQQEIIVLRVKPGITGIWQVTERNATDFRHRVAMDVDYVRNWSPWLDTYVIARTFFVVVKGTGS
jgi:lipopolysaccharide/colanic/teichoic acid biosynthesis glycosyltransferase